MARRHRARAEYLDLWGLAIMPSLAFVSLLALVGQVPAPESASRVDYAALGQEVVAAVRTQFYDAKRA